MTKIKTNQVPGRAKYLYIKLYCEKRGAETSENIHNAAQSWLSLSHRKKEHFYETVSTKSAIKKAQRIIQTEPFLKTKFPSISRKRKRKHANNRKQGNNEHHSEIAATDDNMSLHDDTIMECDSYSNSFAGDDNVDDTLPDTHTQDIDITLQERCESQPVSYETQPVAPPIQTENTTLQERAEEPTPNEPQICDAENSNSFIGDDNVDDTSQDTSTQDIDSTIQGRTQRCESQPVSYETQPVAPPLQTEDTTLQERAEELTNNEPQICDAENQQNSFMNIIDDEDTLSATEIFDEEEEKGPLLEPVLPVAKSGRDLFELLKSRNRSNKAYESLTSQEKNYYGNAVRTIKKDYVQKYKEYLESLTSRQLFDYYRKVFFN